ncbi:hypothetical protein BCR37DRAFT_350585 [Protomyces lactucae-debilis]|uniref:NAD-dependent epimerase/dehydratase domain-containing protein n=1 Tax=Protomyces lactucae-debilis TaxID=2754530 RepID=A0A1Y2F2Y1_PROLT|nr:uncharacterized protein BCR37DRAFT_350585 [Protomyces lactucae-debilis]ORY78222.1 hypothetical protein BCR37DRAFT_350585 [Protomyces lactucae-debilis]
MSVQPGSLVLVTGATGYIAAHVCQQLLEKGYKVRGTARDLTSEKSTHLKDLFKQHGDKFELVQAEDLEIDGVFDDAVQDVDAVLHIASPFHFKVEDPYKDLINPAVSGTKSLLFSAKNKGKKVKSVVITSSVAAIYGPQDKGHVYTEADWNDASVKEIEKTKGSDDFNKQTAYRASKTAAERFGQQFVNEEKPTFAVSWVNPAFVFGPAIHFIKDTDSINTSVAILMNYYLSPGEISANGPTQSFVDVRDVATMHLDAMEAGDKVNNQRFICVSDWFTWQQVVDILAKNYPDRKQASGGPGAGVKEVQFTSDNSKSKKILGTKYIGLEKSVIDTVDSLKQFH